MNKMQVDQLGYRLGFVEVVDNCFLRVAADLFNSIILLMYTMAKHSSYVTLSNLVLAGLKEDLGAGHYSL